MPEFLKSSFIDAPKVQPLDVLIRLLVALALGWVVAWIYRQTHKHAEIVPSFPTTLVLLAVLIAMVTQVIGDNIARAFSLVGALSIVRFRTVVRDTRDTAFVIFSVVVGMAIGARDPWVALIGIIVVGLAAYLMMARHQTVLESPPDYLLHLRVGIGLDLDSLLGGLFDVHLEAVDLISMGTAKQGASFDVTYRARLRPDGSIDKLVKALHKIEGIQSIELRRQGVEED